VPLSEHEQRLLDQIERALYQDDPKFASTVRSTDLRTHMKRRMRRAAVVLAVGVLVLLGGLVSNVPAVGIGGFVLMVGALALALSSWKRLGSSAPTLRAVGGESPAKGAERRTGKPGRTRKPSTPSSGGSFFGRLEERWNKRWDERGREQ
jgi:hypothetical protein